MSPRDRLFQLEIWRRQATGTVAEILGPKELQRDIGNRLFQYRGDLTKELNWYHPRGAAIVGAFVDGINAYIDQTARDPRLLTPEFRMLGIAPGKWTSAVVISRFNGLARQCRQRDRPGAGGEKLGRGEGQGPGIFPARRSGPQARSRHRSVLAVERYLEAVPRLPHPAELHRRRTPARIPQSQIGGAAGTDDRRAIALGPEHAARGYRQQQLGGVGQAHHERLSAADERSASRPGSAVLALLGAAERAGLGRDRRGRAVPARRLHRAQRGRRLGPHHLRHRRRRPLCLRHQSRQSAAIQIQERLGKR